MDDVTVITQHFDSLLHEPTHQAESPSTTRDAQQLLQYDRIPQGRSIRVLDLAPGTWDEPVNCSLRTVHLDDDDLRYEAISYAWGDPTDRKTIICNGYTVSTTRSLFEALQRFRWVYATRTLWADALCINQADDHERTSQVRLMSFIYKRAFRVLIWLQHDDDQIIQDGLNAICRLAHKEDDFIQSASLVATQQQTSQCFYRWRDVEVTSVSGENSSEVTDVAIDALRRICSSPWFGRGWVIQEVVLGTPATVFWGHAEIHFAWLGHATCGVIADHEPDRWSQGMVYCYYLYTWTLSTRYELGLQISFLSLIGFTSTFTFSEPRDRIYGLLGLKTLECDPADGQSFVDPDYSITTKECYRRVAGRLLREWHDLRVLSMVSHSSELDEDWPSWVPDWNGMANTPFVDFFDEGREQNEKAILVGISESTIGEKSCVEISGFKVDSFDRKVEDGVNLGDLQDNVHGPTCLQAVIRTLEHAYGDRCLASTIGNGRKDLPLDSIRIANLLSDYHAFMEKDFVQDVYVDPGTVALVDDFTSLLEPSADRFFKLFTDDKPGRTLFITSTEMLGHGPDIVLPGDVVAVLHGASTPFVLRPAHNGLWRLVGECYLYEVNNGRCHREWEEKGSVSEKFTIY